MTIHERHLVRSLTTAGTLAVLTLAPGSSPQVQGQECVTGPLLDSLKPSRAGFFREVLFAAASARTPRFDAYTDGSYHVNKLDVATGLPAAADQCGLKLEALIVLGPAGPLWTYQLFAFLRDSAGVRVNSVVVPHARITWKSTSLLSPDVVDTLWRTLSAPIGLIHGFPTWPDSVKDSLARDFSFDVLVVRYSSNPPGRWHGTLLRDRDTTNARKLLDALKPVQRTMLVTYGHGN